MKYSTIFYKSIKKTPSFLINLFSKLVPIKNNQILFQCGRGMIDENPKAIYDYIKKHTKQKYKCIWIIDKGAINIDIPKNEYCYSGTIKSLLVQASSKYWIRSESIGSPIKKKKKQIYIQTWHGHGTPKKMGNDKYANKVNQLKHTVEWDYLICESEPSRKIMLSSTGYKGNTVVIGFPSTDKLIHYKDNEEYKQSIRDKFKIDNKKRTILYAPTYRDWQLKQKRVTFPISKLEKLANEHNILVRVHPLIRQKIDKTFFEKNHFIDCCNYPNIEDLLLITDVLITDYSGIFSEYVLLKKPVIFYAFDYERYLSQNGFYMNYETDNPGIVVKTERELYDAIKKKKYNSSIYKSKTEKYNKKFNLFNDGKASERFFELLTYGEFEKNV